MRRGRIILVIALLLTLPCVRVDVYKRQEDNNERQQIHEHESIKLP